MSFTLYFSKASYFFFTLVQKTFGFFLLLAHIPLSSGFQDFCVCFQEEFTHPVVLLGFFDSYGVTSCGLVSFVTSSNNIMWCFCSHFTITFAKM